MSDFFINLCIGGTSSLISSFLCTPIENYPTSIFQISSQKQLIINSNRIFTNTLKYIPNQALALAFKDIYSKLFVRGQNYQHLQNLFLGSLAGASTMLIIYPYEFVAQRTKYLQKLGKRKDLQWKGCFVEILKFDGVFGFYKGIGACISPTMVFRGFQFGMYDSTKDIIEALPFVGQLLWVQLLTFASHIISFPFFKVMVMMKADSLNFNHKPMRYKNTIDCTNHILKSQKLNYLFQGSSQRFLLAIKDTLTLILYDKFQYYLKGTMNYKN